MLPPAIKKKIKPMPKTTKPTPLNKAPIATTWIHEIEKGVREYYIQINNDTEQNKWVRVGDVLEHSYVGKLNDKAFLIAAIKWYKKNVR